MVYRDQLKSWLSYMQRDFGRYIPRDFPAQAFNANVSDDALYSMAMNLYTLVKTSKQDAYAHRAQTEMKAAPESNEMFYLVPHVESDGSIYYIDRFSNRVVMSMIRQSNGLFSYYGPRKMMTVLGGRGELGDMLRRVEDSDFFHDRKQR